MGPLGRPRFEWAELAGTVGGAWSGSQRALDPVTLTPDDDVGAVELLFDDDLPGQERDHLFGLEHEVVAGASAGNEVGHPQVRRRGHASTMPPSWERALVSLTKGGTVGPPRGARRAACTRPVGGQVGGQVDSRVDSSSQVPAKQLAKFVGPVGGQVPRVPVGE